jgi:hypothetical protein
MDYRYLNQSLTRLGVVLVVPRQRSALAQPTERPLYYPPSRQQHKTLGRRSYTRDFVSNQNDITRQPRPSDRVHLGNAAYGPAQV